MTLTLLAPMRGWVGPLEEAPDPVFADRMLGDGVAIDPTGSSLHAPCAGQIISVHRAGHAVSLRADNGAEILMHIGLETVALGGEGFEIHVRDGQAVVAGDLLIAFDLDLLARRARSLLTPIIVTNPELFAVARRDQDRQVEVGDRLMDIVAIRAEGGAERAAAGDFASRRLTVPLAHGIHARPAARISAEAKRFSADSVLATADRRANAKSPVALMALGLAMGDKATLTAAGSDAQAAVAAIARLIEGGLGDEVAVAAIADPRAADAPVVAAGVVVGVRAAPGLAIGPAFVLAPARIEAPPTGAGADREGRALDLALTAVATRLRGGGGDAATARRDIRAAHLALLEDPELNAAARAAIDRGASAGAAWRSAAQAQAAILRAVAEPRIAERADDLIDLEGLVLSEITGESGTAPNPPEQAIVLARDLLPSQLMALEGARIGGICMAAGGPTSHVAILAAAMNIPAVVAAGAAVMGVAPGAMVILDGDAGTLTLAPDDGVIEAAQARMAASRARRVAAGADAHQACRLADGTRIEVFANLASLADAHAAVAAGAEGCGLLRTEFLFLDRAAAPSEGEQADRYQAIAAVLEGRPLIIRTLDVGADKPAPWLDIPAEDNPALGLRGVRIGLWRPEILRDQLRAILRVRPVGQCRVMLPMISSLAEVAAARAMLETLRAEMAIAEPVELGVMIETPAAAVTADLIAARADFLSIGTNDLSQYVLAMDRGNPLLAEQVDALHPAVLRLIFQAAEGGRRYGRPVGVCGALAADPLAAPILIGLGITELSVTPRAVPELKALLRTLSREACVDLGRRAMAEASAAGVRALVNAGASQ